MFIVHGSVFNLLIYEYTYECRTESKVTKPPPPCEPLEIVVVAPGDAVDTAVAVRTSGQCDYRSRNSIVSRSESETRGNVRETKRASDETATKTEETARE